MRGREVQEFERTLKQLFDQLDDELEAKWGSRYPLHPSRPAAGEAYNKEDDGLFNVGATFSAGYGSEAGKGYVVDVRMVTLQSVDAEVREEIMAYTTDRIDELLPRFFPDRQLSITRDGDLFKIVGDLSLG